LSLGDTGLPVPIFQIKSIVVRPYVRREGLVDGAVVVVLLVVVCLPLLELLLLLLHGDGHEL
jgi:hypothetical protein